MAMPDMQAPQSPAPQSPAPQGAPAGAAGGGQDIKPMLIKVLQKVMQTAEQAGLDFNALVAEVAGSSQPANAPEAPASPMSPSPASMSGGGMPMPGA